MICTKALTRISSILKPRICLNSFMNAELYNNRQYYIIDATNIDEIEKRKDISERYYELCKSKTCHFKQLSEFQMKRILNSPKDWHDRLFSTFIDVAIKQYNMKTEQKFQRSLKKQKRHFLKDTARSPIRYGLWNNSLFSKFSDRISKRYYEVKKANKYFDSDKIVIDCGYEIDMYDSRCNALAFKIGQFYFLNRSSDFPFDIYLCNLRPKSPLCCALDNLFKNKLMNHFFVTEESYLDIFNKADLIYLSSEARYSLKTLKDGRIFIIAALSEEQQELPYTLAKCKEENITSAKLPVDKYLHLKQSSRPLPMNVICKILVNYRYQDNWQTAFKCVPQSMVYNIHEKFNNEMKYPIL